MRFTIPQFTLRKLERNEAYEQLLNGLGAIGLFYSGIRIVGDVWFFLLAFVSILLVYVRVGK